MDGTEREKLFPQTFESFLRDLQAPGVEVTYFKHFTEGDLMELKKTKPVGEAFGKAFGKKKLKIKAEALILNGNNLKDEGASVFCSLLKDNKSLKRFEMNSNKITGEGAKAVAAALASNRHLETLGLNNNKLDATAVGFLAEALVDHKSLAYISLKGNPFGSGGQDILRDVVNLNLKLTIIGSDNKPILNTQDEQLSPEEKGELDTEVGRILQSNDLARYARKFFIRNINTIEDAMKLTPEDYTTIGVIDVGDRATLEKLFRPSATLSRAPFGRSGFRTTPSSLSSIHRSKTDL